MSLCRSGLFCLALALWGTAIASQNIVKSDAFLLKAQGSGDYNQNFVCIIKAAIILRKLQFCLRNLAEQPSLDLL